MRLIRLFSWLIVAFSIAYAQELSENIAVKVKVIGELKIEKPPIHPPAKIRVDMKLEPLELSNALLEPPKKLEKVSIKKPESKTFGCGEPKDRINYNRGVKAYLEGRYSEARDYLMNVFAMDISPFKPMASYILGIMYAERGKEKKALEFFRLGCDYLHLYRDASCESYYAYYFRVNGSPLDASQEYPLWAEVYRIKNSGKLSQVDCSETIYREYCSYVNAFVRGELHEDYPESSSLRRAIVLLEENPEGSLEILKKHIKPLSKYRDIALYYYSVALIRLGRVEEAIDYISILETINREYAKGLYALVAKENLGYTLLAYKLTGNKELLSIAGTIAYNRKEYKLALDFFDKAEDYRGALYSALMLGNYEKALSILERESLTDEEHYRWKLESLLRLGKYKELERELERVKERYPNLYREYAGWLFFKLGDWQRAAEYLPEGYQKVVALYNSGDYEKVIGIIQNPKDDRERLLLARASIAMGRGELAREYLTGDSDEELYLRGMSFFIEGDYTRAIDSFGLIGAESPYRIKALLKIGDSYYNLGDFENAKRIYMGILKSFPDSQEAKEATLALVQIELQNPSADIKELIPKFIEQFPDSSLIPDLYYQLADTYLKEGDVENAKRVFRILTQYENYKEKAMLKLAQLEDSPEEKEEILLQLLESDNTKIRQKAVSMLKELYKKEGKKEELAKLLLGGDFEDRKEALKIYLDIDIERAQELLQELIKENREDEELTRAALTLFKKTGKPYYLKIARNSLNKEVKAQALYLLGKHLKRKKKNREALESFLEVVLSAKGVAPYYNESILEASELLLYMKARSDAACLLNRLDKTKLTLEQSKRVKMLKEKLPECKKKQGE